MSNLEICESIIKECDVNNIFEKFKHEKVNKINVQQFYESPNSKFVKVDLFDNKENHITFKDKPLKVTYIRDYKLRKIADKRGKVVYLDQIFLNENYRKDKIATKLHKRQIKFYEKNEFDQIQLDGVFEGSFVWARPPFNFEVEYPCDEAEVIRCWRNYLISEFKDDEKKEELLKSVKTIKGLPKEYLLPTNGKISFSDWYKKKDLKLSVSMYKNLEKSEK